MAKEDPRFEQFWKLYPRHTAKAVARASFLKVDPDPDLFAIILRAIEEQKTWPQWNKNDGEFIPMPATWLNQERWEDEPVKLPGRNSAPRIDVAAICAAEEHRQLPLLTLTKTEKVA